VVQGYDQVHQLSEPITAVSYCVQK